jgi:hypothetical protein
VSIAQEEELEGLASRAEAPLLNFSLLRTVQHLLGACNGTRR